LKRGGQPGRSQGRKGIDELKREGLFHGLVRVRDGGCKASGGQMKKQEGSKDPWGGKK